MQNKQCRVWQCAVRQGKAAAVKIAQGQTMEFIYGI